LALKKFQLRNVFICPLHNFFIILTLSPNDRLSVFSTTHRGLLSHSWNQLFTNSMSHFSIQILYKILLPIHYFQKFPNQNLFYLAIFHTVQSILLWSYLYTLHNHIFHTFALVTSRASKMIHATQLFFSDTIYELPCHAYETNMQF